MMRAVKMVNSVGLNGQINREELRYNVIFKLKLTFL